MNRAERRRLAKHKLTHKDLKFLELKAADKAIDYSAKMYSMALALTLHDKLGFGKKRCQRFIAQVHEKFKDIESGYLSLEDVVKTVEEELDIHWED